MRASGGRLVYRLGMHTEPSPSPSPLSMLSESASASEQIAAVRASFDALRAEIGKVIVGQQDVVEQILICIFCRGHALVVGVPGLAKTLLISTISRTLHLGFSRVQFTPDLMPTDITGTEVIEEDKATGRRGLRFVPGPIFANVVLADEINRTPPKTQAALLEAMQERQVTVGGVRHELPKPFFVLATQNPLEQEGTYPLPEAQLDRFMFQILIRYPTAEEELEVVRRSAGKDEAVLHTVLKAGDIERVARVVRSVPVSETVLRYCLRLVRATRVGEPADAGVERPEVVRNYVAWGAGPRGSENLVLAAQAKALLSGEDHVTAEHVRQVAKPVLRHRVLLNFNAQADQVSADAVIDGLLASMPVAEAGGGESAELDRVLLGSR